ncbi:MAG: cadherin-like beta sandwich domain-containing protein [Nitrospiraceae bacterium]
MLKVFVDAAAGWNRQVKPRQGGRSAWWRGGAAFILLVTALTGCIPSSDAPPGPNRAADLANLELSEGALSPAFGPDELNYTVSVGSNTASITITPTLADARATVKINNQSATSGQPFGPINLELGTNPPITILVDGPGISKTYTIVVTRAPNADLEKLELSAGVLEPAFDPNKTTYEVKTGFTTPDTMVTAAVADDTSSLTINGTAVNSGQPFGPITLSVGSSNLILIRVTAANGVTKDYQVTVLRTGTTNLATLSASATAIAFNANTFTYNVSTGFTTDQTTITATPVDDTASVTVNLQGPVLGGGTYGPFPLALGPNTFTIVVTSPTVASKTYTVTITRQPPSTNANLSNLTVNPPGGTVTGFNPGNLGPYTVTVASDQTSVTVAGFLEDQKARLTINNVPANSGQGISVTLASPAPSSTPVNVTVVSESGNVQTYGLIINRAAPASSNANLLSLAVSPGQLQPDFSPGTTNYNASVASDVIGIIFTAAPQDGGATMTISLNNGSPSQLAAGQNFIVQPLQVGNNSVRIRVTAPAGNTKDYITTVNRATPPSTNALLQTLTVNPPSSSNLIAAGVFTYNVTVPFSVTSTTITAVPQVNPGATVTFIYQSSTQTGSPFQVTGLVEGLNTVTVRVTAPAGNTQDYTVRITRETASGNNNLSNLVVSAGTLNPNNVPFNPSITSYTVSVPNTTASTTVTASLQEPTTATMTLSVNNGTPSNLQHNVPSSSIALAVGDTKLDIVVRAQNGTLKTYTVTVTRNP